MKRFLPIILCLFSYSAFSQTFAGLGGAIPDYPGGQVCFNIPVSGITSPLYSDFGLVSVTVNINHTYDSDLEIMLISPNGIQTILSSNNGGSGDNYTNTVFTMSASNAIQTGSAPFTGNFLPEQSFYAQNIGQNGNGTWTLCVTDILSSDMGELLNWSLNFGANATGSPAPTPNPPASDLCVNAPLICNLNGYTGSTFTTYTFTPANEPSGTAQPSPGPAGTFCGTQVNNSSWIKFQAGAPNVSLNIDVTNCTGIISSCGERGIQLALYDGCGAPWNYSPSSIPSVSNGGCTNNEKSPSCYGDGIYGLNQIFSFNNLVIGHTYYIMFDGWAGNQCDYSINVNNGIQIVSITPTSNPMCEGDTITLTANAPGNLNTFTWTSVPSSSLPSGSNISIHPTSSTVYTVQASGLCNSQTASVAINVTPSGNPSWTPPAAMCANHAIIDLNTLVTGTLGGSWSGTHVTGSDFDPSGLNGNYTITYRTGTAPCQKTRSHTITVLPTPTPSISLVGDSNLCAYQTATLNVSSVVSGTYLWNTGSTASGIQITNSGTYTVTMTNVSSNCSATASYHINMNHYAQSNPVISPINPVICNGQPVTLNTTTPYIGYQWNTGSINSSISVIDTGRYFVITEDNNHCFDTASTHIQTASINGTITGSNKLCTNDTVHLSLPLGANSYSWSTGNTSNAISVITPGSYSVTVTTANGCTDRDTIIITPVQNPVADAGFGSDTLCNTGSLLLGGSPTASGGTGPYQYIWSPVTDLDNSSIPNPTAVNRVGRSYHLLVTDANACKAKDSVYVRYQNMSADAGGGIKDSLCSGGTIILGGNPSANGGTAPYVYSWTPSWFLSDDSVANPFCTTNQTYNVYVLEIKDAYGCISKDTVNLNYEANLAVEAGWGFDTICIIESQMLGGDPTADGSFSPFIYQWIPGDYLDDSTIANPTTTNPNDGYYTVIVEDAKHCKDLDSVYIKHQDLTLEMGVDLQDNIAPEEVAFSAITGGATIFEWTFGDGDTSSLKDPLHLYEVEGIYDIKLIGYTDATKLCYDSAKHQIEIFPFSQVVIPNIITPNYDNFNDLFKIESKGLKSLKVDIYNRWGTLIYTFEELGASWDGRVNGLLNPDGTYFYVVSAEGIDKKEYLLQGYFQLLR